MFINKEVNISDENNGLDVTDPDQNFAQAIELAQTVAKGTAFAHLNGVEFSAEQTKELSKKLRASQKGLDDDQIIVIKKEFHKTLTEEVARIDAEEAEAAAISEEATTKREIVYKSQKKFEYAVDAGDEAIVPKTRQQYAVWFKQHQLRTAKATLQMCRTVYEAAVTLGDCDFESFCKEIGFDSSGSTIRKFMVIGKVYPRLIDFADKLPVAWTSIYALTQIPADDFELMVQRGFNMSMLSGAEIKNLVDKTRDLNAVRSPFKQDKKLLAYPVAKLFFTEIPDDDDFRLLQKALNEVCARLPMKAQLVGEHVKLFEQRRKQRYEQLKREADDVTVKPQDWDFGEAANQVYSQEQRQQALFDKLFKAA